MNHLIKTSLLDDLSKIEQPTYENFLKGKLVRKPFKKATKIEDPLQFIYSNVCGVMNSRA